jgi:hypothetical protein
MFRSKASTIVFLLLIALILTYAFVIGPAQDCQRMSVTMNRSYYFHPLDGCWLQTAEGNYQRVDQRALSNYQP